MRMAGSAQGDLKRDMTSMSSSVDTTAGASLMNGSQFSNCSQVCGLSTFTPVHAMLCDYGTRLLLEHRLSRYHSSSWGQMWGAATCMSAQK